MAAGYDSLQPFFYMQMEEGTMFEPGRKELKKEYKELSEIHEFKDLSDIEVRLCWYVGCESSPYQNLEEEERLIKALMLLEFSDEVSAKYAEKEKMPEKLRIGIDKMKSFNLGVRMASNLAIEEAFRNVTAVMYIPKAELMGKVKLEGMDMAARKQYVEMIFKTAEGLDRLIEKAEIGFGVKTKSDKEKQTGKGSGLADSVVKEIHEK